MSIKSYLTHLINAYYADNRNSNSSPLKTDIHNHLTSNILRLNLGELISHRMTPYYAGVPEANFLIRLRNKGKVDKRKI